MNRRTFAMSALTAFSASRVAGANDRIRMGWIGSGGRGRQDLATFLKQPDADPVAICDLYEPFRDKAIEMAAGRPKGFDDFRQLLEQKDVDAVVVAVPDHWHALIAIAACEAGKDVYCEKPLSLTVAEGRRMVEAARKHGRVFQTGSQQRSGAHYAQAVKLIRDGGIGEVHRIQAGMQRNIFPGLQPTEMASGIRPGFNWEMWLGPAPERPFDPFRCIYNFRWFWDYSGGQMTNWGAHHLDIARWIVGADAPTEVAGFGGRYALTDGGETPDIQEVTYQFPKVVVTWTVSEIAEGKPVTLDIYGTKGKLTLLRSGFQVTPEMIGPGKDKKPAMEPLQAKGGDLDGAHARNFLDCVKSRQRPNADVEEGHRSAVMCHLGNISTRLGRSLRWDAAAEQITGDAEANRWLSRPYRAPWKLS
ncbi:MAG TPA: Gfo/Idh/MocA family oxidoreductase [Bryobacteraceae bacterium]|nr:Gfo/Idh/MocA family oxidoreductase [Bryobacteraceae bacterium]